MADKENMFIVNGAKTSCSMGLRKSKLILQNDHGIFIRKKPQITVSDCLANQNVISFGGCVSIENPDTQKQMREMGIKPTLSDSYSRNIENTFCNSGLGVTPIPCAGKCIPAIISSSWEDGKEDTEIDDKQALLGRGTLTCIYGGLILIEDTGQA